MGSPISKITLVHNAQIAADIKGKIQQSNGDPEHQIEKIVNYMSRLGSGLTNGTLTVAVDDGDGVAASGTVTFSSLANNDTVTVAGIVFTAKTSGASGAAQFNLGANDTAAAVNFAAAVNAHASLTLVCTASPAAAVTTITAAQTGLIGNLITLAISAHGSVSAAALAGGTNSANLASYSFSFGV